MTIYKVTYKELDVWTGKYDTWNRYFTTKEKAEAFIKRNNGNGKIIEITVE